MKLKKIYIFVEGNDDERFFKSAIAPKLLEKYDDVEIIKYRQWRKEKVNLFLLSIQTLGFDYIFTADMDFEHSVNKKKQSIQKVYTNAALSSIEIVIVEIESWYMAGLSDNAARKMKMSAMKNTDLMTKEDFNDIFHRKYRSRIDFMHEILKVYDIETASIKNKSFRYFAGKYLTVDRA